MRDVVVRNAPGICFTKVTRGTCATIIIENSFIVLSKNNFIQAFEPQASLGSRDRYII